MWHFSRVVSDPCVPRADPIRINDDAHTTAWYSDLDARLAAVESRCAMLERQASRDRGRHEEVPLQQGRRKTRLSVYPVARFDFSERHYPGHSSRELLSPGRLRSPRDVMLSPAAVEDNTGSDADGTVDPEPSPFQETKLQAIESEATHTVAESIWEGVFLINSNTISTSNSILLGVCLAFNVFAQFLFCEIVSSALVKDSYPSVASLRRWRHTAGHDIAYADQSGWVSMTSRVCNGDGALAYSTVQQRVHSSISHYTEAVLGASLPHEGSLLSIFPMPYKGVVLSLFVIVLWCLFVCEEVFKAISFYRALWILKGGRTVLYREDGEFIIDSVSFGRLFVMLLVTAMRMLVAAILMVSGSLWLAESHSLRDMLLDSAALSFILSVDEVLFSAIAPLAAKVLVRSIRPLRRDPVMFSSGIDMAPPSNILISVLAISVVLHFFLIPEQVKMAEMSEALCGGNQDFVVGVMPSTGSIVTSSTRPFSEYTAGGHDDLYFAAAEEAVLKSSLDDSLTMSVWYRDKRRFQAALALSAEEMAETASVCEDQVGAPLEARLPTLRHLTGLPLAKTCASLLRSCTEPSQTLLRFTCPVTCGCDSPVSGLVLSTPAFGCPRDVCHTSPRFRAVWASLPCSDTPVAELRRMHGWASYWEQFVDVVASESVHTRAELEPLRDRFVELGCAALVANWTLLGYTDLSLNLCSTGGYISSLHPFCPESCGCRVLRVERCPSSCAEVLPSTR